MLQHHLMVTGLFIELILFIKPNSFDLLFFFSISISILINVLLLIQSLSCFGKDLMTIMSPCSLGTIVRVILVETTDVQYSSRKGFFPRGSCLTTLNLWAGGSEFSLPRLHPSMLDFLLRGSEKNGKGVSA